MLRYTTDRPGLVALYDIWPGNGAGLFLQPGARTGHKDQILIHNLHVLKCYRGEQLIEKFPQNGWRLCSLILAQQIESRAMADIAHHVLLRTLMQSMIWHSVRRVHQGHTQLPVRSSGKLAFCGGQWDASFADIQIKCLKKELKRGRESNSITDQPIDQRQDHLNACLSQRQTLKTWHDMAYLC